MSPRRAPLIRRPELAVLLTVALVLAVLVLIATSLPVLVWVHG